MKQVGEHQYRLTPFHCQFLHSPQNDHPFIINYCSDKKTFIFFSHLIPFSKQNIFAASAMISPRVVFLSRLFARKEPGGKRFMEALAEENKSISLKAAVSKDERRAKAAKKGLRNSWLIFIAAAS